MYEDIADTAVAAVATCIVIAIIDQPTLEAKMLKGGQFTAAALFVVYLWKKYLD